LVVAFADGGELGSAEGCAARRRKGGRDARWERAVEDLQLRGRAAGGSDGGAPTAEERSRGTESIPCVPSGFFFKFVPSGFPWFFLGFEANVFLQSQLGFPKGKKSIVFAHEAQIYLAWINLTLCIS
jgi:hypothetical protein